MYLPHFGLRDRPFRIVPSPRYFYVSETHDEGRARILYGIRENRGFVVVTGGVGLGKTTVLLSVIDEIESEMEVALIVNPVDSFEQLLRMICAELGASAKPEDEAGLVTQLNDMLLASYARGRTCVLMLDEAQNLSLEVLEKVRTLSNLQTEETSLLQVVLVGQPELTAKLNDHRIRQLRQRIGVWHEIQPLDEDETDAYIRHRLQLSGAHDPDAVIEPGARRAIHEFAQGIPRLVNQLCDTALVVAYGAGVATVGKPQVVEAAAELHLDEDEGGETPQTSRPRRRVGRWAIAAVVLVGLIAASGFGWKALGPQLMNSLKVSAETVPGGGEGAPSVVSPESSELAFEEPVVDTPSDEEPVDEDSTPVDLAVALDEMWALERTERLAEVERVRATAPLVYSAHLASFRERERVDLFSRQLLQRHPQWTEPLYVEEAGSDDTWYRVLAGGTASRSEALQMSRTLKDDFDLDYSQVTRMHPRAVPIGTTSGTALAVGGTR